MNETLCRPKFPGRHLIEACNICRSINPAQRRCCKVDKTTHAKVIGWVIPCALFFVRDYLIDIDSLKSNLPVLMLLKWKCSMSFAIYVLLHSGPSNSFFLHLGISLKSSKENSLGNLARYVGPYDGTIEVRLETIHQTLLEKHIPSLAFFGYIPAQTRLFRNSHSGFHKGSCHHKTSSAITHTQ